MWYSLLTTIGCSTQVSTDKHHLIKVYARWWPVFRDLDSESEPAKPAKALAQAGYRRKSPAKLKLPLSVFELFNFTYRTADGGDAGILHRQLIKGHGVRKP